MRCSPLAAGTVSVYRPESLVVACAFSATTLTTTADNGMSASLVTRPLMVVCCAASVAGTNPNANATRASVLREGSLMTLATPLDVEDTNATATREPREQQRLTGAPRNQPSQV